MTSLCQVVFSQTCIPEVNKTVKPIGTRHPHLTAKTLIRQPVHEKTQKDPGSRESSSSEKEISSYFKERSLLTSTDLDGLYKWQNARKDQKRRLDRNINPHSLDQR